VANAQAYEEERMRAEALATIDRAKTAFFNNVSHEFRTPLTLMLGPLEEALAESEENNGAQQERLDLAYRNALRLQKLVNTLLDFSRIEAGRIEATYQLTNLTETTTELASMFQSAIEKAGLQLEIDCPPLPGLVYVDRDMWEKIVLNLLSNALKHTFEGSITIRQYLQDDHIELVIKDTGTGIAQDQLPHLFERFHRVANARSRTHEGSGIGLALVNELVKLHGGEIKVTSEEGKGTIFTISMPTGKAHLPADRINTKANLTSTSLGAKPFVQEASRWVPGADTATKNAVLKDQHLEWRGIRQVEKAKILLADDNADMRNYVKKLLEPFCNVFVVSDGEAALELAQKINPDLVLSDVMMPKMDGFQLLQAVRSNPSLKSIPVILLSARAGEEARIEGLQAGADDYLSKPFNARELLIRIKANLDLYSGRQQQVAEAIIESEERFRTLADQIPVTVYMSDLEARVTYWNKHWLEFTGQTFEESLGRAWKEVVHPHDLQNLLTEYLATTGAKQRYSIEARVKRVDGIYHWFLFTGGPRYMADGTFAGYVGTGIDINDRKEAREHLERLVNERTIELKRSNEDLQQFAHVASHDLKEPARKIKIFAGRLEDDKETTLSEKGKLYLQKVQSAADRLFTMINGVLSYSTLTASEEIKEPINLNKTIKNIETDLEIVIQQKDAVIRYADLPTINGSSVLLYQLFYNLINNSLKFSKPEEPPVIHITATPIIDEGLQWMQLDLKDNGIGFSKNESQKIFDTFTRLNPKDQYDGTGLGLALCRKIVQRYGGSIDASGEDGMGAVFTILLPDEGAANQ
jgi:PAS domain S-box-containing protein